MNLTRKEFLFRGVFSFGRLLAEAVHPPEDEAPQTDESLRVRLDNGRCLARRGGCFSCLEHCPEDAITIDIGIGIGIDPDRCNGCGVCGEICPLEPKAITLALPPASGTTA